MLNRTNDFLERCLSNIPEGRYVRRLRKELEGHLAALEADLTAAGYPPEEARAEAVRRMGDPAALNRDYLAAWQNSLPAQWEYRLKTWVWNYFVVMFGAQLFVMLAMGWACMIADWFLGYNQNPLARLMEESVFVRYTLPLAAALLAGACYLREKFKITRHPTWQVGAGLTLYWASDAALRVWLEAYSHQSVNYQRTFWEQIELWSSYPEIAVNAFLAFALCVSLGAVFGHLSAAKAFTKEEKIC